MSTHPRVLRGLCARCQRNALTSFPTRTLADPKSLWLNTLLSPILLTSGYATLRTHQRIIYSPIVRIKPPRLRLARASRKAPIPLTRLENAIKTLLLDVARSVHEELQWESGPRRNVSRPELRLTGGWVRDKLRGVKSPDIDVSVTGVPVFQFCSALREYLQFPENAKKYEALLPETNFQRGSPIIRKNRGNTTSMGHSGICVANLFRMYVDFINPHGQPLTEEFRPSDVSDILKKDAYRRDATINAIFYNLQTDKLEDYTERGKRDIQNRVIHTPGDPHETLAADPVRILRLIRLSSKLGYNIHEDTLKAMYDEKIRAGLRNKDRRRPVRIELNKILADRNPRHIFQLIDRLVLYPDLFADDIEAIDTSSWSFAYDALWRLLHPREDDSRAFKESAQIICSVLLRNESDTRNAWMIALLAPCFTLRPSPVRRYPPLRVVDIAMEWISSNLNDLVMLSHAGHLYKGVIDAKTILLENSARRTSTEIQEQANSFISGWGPNWRISVITAILLEAMDGHNIPKVIQDYGRFLRWYTMKK